MLLSEVVAFLLFLGAVGLVYLLEGAILVRAVWDKRRGRKAGRILWSKPAIIVHALAGIGLACLLYGRFIEPTWIEVNRFDIETPALEQARFRIVHISDLHCDAEPLNEQQTISLINAMEPDVIVFTGDALNSEHGIPRFKQTMSDLRAKLGKFAVRGNFETGRMRNADLYEGMGFTLLENATEVLEKNDETIFISGLACDWPDKAGQLLSTIDTDRYTIFLHHWSDLIEQASDADVDLYLCGHTHGGQVALPFYGAIITLSKLGKKYEAGLYQVDTTQMYVNRGLGVEPPPAPKVRFLARPEIAVFDIRPKR